MSMDHATQARRAVLTESRVDNGGYRTKYEYPRQHRAWCYTMMEEIIADCEAADRSMTDAERQQFDQCRADVREIEEARDEHGRFPWEKR